MGLLTTDEAAQNPSVATRFRPLQAILALGGIQALTMGAGLARTKLLALLLGPAGLGIVGVIDQTVALVTHLGSLSFPFAALTFLSRRRGEGAESFARLYLAFFKLLLAASLLATALAVGIALWRTTLIAEALAPYRLPLVLGLAGAPALAVTAFLRSVLAAVERHHQAALFALLGGVALIGTSFAGVLLGGLTGLYLGNLAVALLMAPLIVRYLRSSGAVARGGGGGGKPALDVLRGERGLVGFCTTIHLLSLFSPLAYLIARVAVLNHHGVVEAGLFHAAYGLAIAVRVVLGQANLLYLTPILNQPTAKAERTAAAAEYLRVLIVILMLGALAIVLFPREWLLLLYSPRFTGAAAFLAAFVVAEAILLIASVYQMLLIGFDDVRAHALIAVAGQVVLALLSLAWVPALGSLGVALALLVGHAVILVLLLLRLRQKHHGPALARPLYLLLAALGVLAAAGWWAVVAPPAALWKLALYLLVTGGSVSLLTAEERRWLLAPWRKR